MQKKPVDDGGAWLADGVMFFGKALTYGYANARVRSMRPALLSRRQAEDLLKVNTSAAAIDYLSRTNYRNDFAGLPAKATDEERVELALGRNFSRTARKLLEITPKHNRRVLSAFLNRYDIHNMKTIMLGRKLGKGREETQALIVPAGTMSAREIASLVNAKGADDFHAALRGTAFGAKFLTSASMKHISQEQLRALFQNPAESAKLDVFLSALDFYYYEMASAIALGEGKDAQAIAKLLRSEADAKNIMMVLRLKKQGAERKAIAGLMVDGGKLSRATLEKLASAKDAHEVVSLSSGFFISQTGRDEFAAAEQRFGQDGMLSHFEVVFERSIARRSLHALRRSMMSVGAIVGFLLLKEEEMRNIQKIVRGKALRLPPDKVAEMLVLVG